MRDGYAWVSLWTVLLVDLSQYGIKEWLAVVGSLFGIAGSIFGLWRAWRYSKSHIATRLLEYLRDQEATIREARNRIIHRLRSGEAVGKVVEVDHEFYREQARPRLELEALVDSAPHLSAVSAYRRAAAAFLRAGELAARLNRNRQGPEFLKEAWKNYRLADDSTGMMAAREMLEKLGEDVSTIPRFDARAREIPWFWVRLALEVSILATAAGTFYLMLR